MEVCSCYLLIQVKFTLVRFSTYITGSNLAEIVKIEKPTTSNKNDVDREL